MNKQRRKDLDKVIADLEQWREDASELAGRIEEIKGEIESVRDD
jgi:prefoldin subunit 5